MDENVAYTSLSLVTALLDVLKRNGTLTDQELDDIFANAPTFVGTIDPSFNDVDRVITVLQRVRKALDSFSWLF